MMHDWSASMAGWEWFWMIAALVAVCVVAAAGFVIARGCLQRGGRRAAVAPPSRPGAEEVLAQRFARGEIDEDEYWQRVHALRAVDPR
jgi:putative membrane protein